jgi:hypothetical protein
MASGDSLVVWSAHGNMPATANYATFDTRNNHLVIDFDGTTAETAFFPGVMPRHYSSGGITASLAYSMTSASSGAVVWEVSIERLQSGTDTLDTNSFGTAVAGTATISVTAGVMLYKTLAMSTSQIDAVAAGEAFRVKVRRTPSDAGDTASGDAEFSRLELYEN